MGDEAIDGARAGAKKAVMDLLRGRELKARFATEIFALLRRRGLAADEAERLLAELEAEGVVMIRAHFCADPHLAGADLRIVAPLKSAAGTEPLLSAIRALDSAWDKWLTEYLTHHRCG